MTLAQRRALPIRTVLVTTTVVCLVLLYVIWWTTYAVTHQDERFAQQPPGAPGRIGDTSITLLSLTRTPLLADQDYGREPEVAPPGAVWVVAVLHAVRDPGERDLLCTYLKLLGPGGRQWDSASQFKRSLPYCGEEELAPGGSQRFEMVFSVPEALADQVVGVALSDASTPDRVPVITPAG